VTILFALPPLPSRAMAGETEEPIKIGAIFALSGKAKNSNNSAVLGVRLAVEEINAAGGLLGRPIELLMLDNESTPIGSHLAAEAANRAGVAAIIGASWSSHSLAIAKVAEQHRIPMVSPVSTIPSLTAGGEHIFRVCYTDTLQGATLARFAHQELHARSALLFVDISSDFSLNIAQIFKNTFTELGGTVRLEIEYKTGQTDFSVQIRQALGAESDVVFLAGYDESGYIAAKLQEAGLRAIPLGSDGWDAESFYTLGGNAIRLGYYINHWFPGHDDQSSQDFLARYGKRGEIKAPTVLAYDAVKVVAAAIGNTASADRREIRRGLGELRDYPGVTGKISFDAQGDAIKTACIIEIRDGKPHHHSHYPQQP
jgi:branched-chain amino acid transport system substrate-binding protein